MHLVLLGSMSLFSPYLRHRYPSSGSCTACLPRRRLLRAPPALAVAMGCRSGGPSRPSVANVAPTDPWKSAWRPGGALDGYL